MTRSKLQFLLGGVKNFNSKSVDQDERIGETQEFDQDGAAKKEITLNID